MSLKSLSLKSLFTCVALLSACYSAAALAAESDPAADAGALFDKLDANHTGRLTADQIPAEKRGLFERLLRMAGKQPGDSLTRDQFIAQLKSGDHPTTPASNKSDTGKSDAGKSKNDAGAKSDANGKSAGGDNGKSEPPKPATPTSVATPAKPQVDPGKLFDRLDAKQTGKLSVDDVPEERREMFKRLLRVAGQPATGSLDREQFVKAVETLRGKAAASSPPTTTPTPTPNPPVAGQIDVDQAVGRLMKLSKRSDGKLTISDLPERLKPRFDRIDANHDGLIDEKELRTWLELVKNRTQAAASTK